MTRVWIALGIFLFAIVGGRVWVGYQALAVWSTCAG